MLTLIWFFRMVSFPLGLACIFVSLDMLYVWGLDGRRPRRRRYPRPPRPPRQGGPVGYRTGARPPGRYTERPIAPDTRPHPNAWVWWEWKVRRPAFYLLMLGLALVVVGVLTWLPGYGNIPWISDHLEGLAVLILGLILLRGTLKISSPLVWKKITLIKRPLSGKSRPSVPWMGLGLLLTMVGLYGIVCGFASPAACGGNNPSLMWSVVFTVGELVFGAVGVMGVEDIFQALQERSSLSPWSLRFFGIGAIGVVVILIGRTLVL